MLNPIWINWYVTEDDDFIEIDSCMVSSNIDLYEVRRLRDTYDWPKRYPSHYSITRSDSESDIMRID